MNNIVNAMKNTYQVEGKQTILQHGLKVYSYTLDLIGLLKGLNSKYNQKIPTWMKDNSEYILSRLLDQKIIKHYCIWHDMGKPFCKPDHQIKFLNHELVSYELWSKMFPNKTEVAELILNDMKIHKVRSHNFEDFKNTPNLLTHILVGLAEINSNSEMFGGVNSDSYKMKYKNFEKFSKRAIKEML